MRFDLKGHATVPDAVLGLVLAVVFSAGAATVPGIGPLSYAVIAVGCLALAVRRRAPTLVLLVTTACMLAYTVGADPAQAAAFPVMIAVYTAVRHGRRHAAVISAIAGLVFLAGSLAASLTADATQPAQALVERTILLMGWFLAAGVSGTVSRHRQAYLEQAEQRAAEAERTREATALRRAGEERLRIARELHDSLTHSISVIKVQAGVAVHLARKRGEEVPEALLAIQEASADAMRELRATLEVLRDADDPAGSGLDRVDDLVARVGAAGLPTTVTVTGPARALPAHVERAAYRIIQEALTNASRHAGPATATVTLAYGGRELTVQIDDDGLASPSDPPTPGNGLTGMRERVTALGGSLHAHPRPHGGFTVRADLPTEDLS
ncbi:sensor histidine kinase [Microtetraspora malaysiensis]|uniref:sensor histidine kinase n=1 Tax=Microtetraspora malaysiensis TaxID=161358 RepID=UPI000831D432|nr:sensor histidine kinase [Microtetraspora malaysiensis]